MSKRDRKQACCSTGFKTTCGGQALIEGIMMRGPKKQAAVVRRPDGELEIKEQDLHPLREKCPVWGWPLVRGVVTFLDSMINGVKMLMWSAEFYPEDGDAPAEEPSKFEQWLEKKLGSAKFTSLLITIAVILGIGLSVVLFFLLPTLLGTAVKLFTDSMVVRNVAESVLKIVIFLAYLAICSRTKDIHRVFQYHGAEHKTIFCYEQGLPLTVDNVRTQPRHHPRCGTSFLFVVIIVSILVSTLIFSIWPVQNALLRFAAHLVMLPLIVGISYEFNRWAGRNDNALTRVLVAPGLWMQNFTTYEPDDGMIEVAIRALELVLPEEKGSDQW
ncbi:MAG: DUF1385 domain-containing protein [Oscillospiraceae bacterium]|nr:DUF1385 domain-containing protein [Oscillospiraceae bacterium]